MSADDISLILEGSVSAIDTTLSVSTALEAKGSQRSSRSKSGPTFMDKRRMFSVIIDKVDLTPEDIVHPEFPYMDESYRHAAFETRVKDDISLQKSKSKMGVTTDESSAMKVYATTINLDDIHIDHRFNTEEGLEDLDVDFERAPSAFYLPKMYPLTSYPPEITVTLKESETHALFEMPSVSYEKGSEDANVVEEENVYYEYITVGKGKNRKMVTEDTQTEATVTQTRHTLATRPNKKNAISFASLWDMHDTYARMAKPKTVSKKDEMVLYQSAAPNMLRKTKVQAQGPIVQPPKTFEEIASTHAFQDAVLLVERVLASLEYGKSQKTFRGLISIDPLSLDLVYIYSMRPLWTFDCEDTRNIPIILVAFNHHNPNILAVAYGKFTYAEDCNGMVCVWCSKNPIKPERLYRFDSSVTSVSFSEKNPNWLACGFWNGDVIILDITHYSIKTIAVSNRETNPCFDPVWGVHWRAVGRDYEYVMTTSEDGRINKFVNTKTHEFLCTPMMRVSTVEGKLKGLEVTKSCLRTDVPITRYPGVLCMIWHPSISHVYFVGTTEGCIHKCSTHYLNQHIDVFRAHVGPVYDIMVCPFHKNLMMTCGADNAIRLWMEGMDDMILTLNCPSAVYGAVFSPINATIIISVSGNVILIWDIRRKTHMPCAEYTFPIDVTLTYVRFDGRGENLFVGDTLGRVHTFHLEDTPIPPYYQRIMLDEVLRKALCTRPQMIRQLNKLDRYRQRHAATDDED